MRTTDTPEALKSGASGAYFFDDVTELFAYPLDDMAQRTRDDLQWFGGLTIGQGKSLALAGDPKQAAKVAPLFDTLADKIPTPRIGFVPSVAGAYPVVAEAIAGSPYAMRKPERQRTASAPLRIVVDLWLQWNIDAEAIRRRGVAVLALATALSGVRPVEVMACAGSDSNHGSGAFWLVWPVGHAPLNLAQACGLLANPPLVRAFCFSAQRTLSACTSTIARPHATKEERDRILGLTERDIYLPPMTSEDLASRDPEKFVRDMLEKYADPDAEE